MWCKDLAECLTTKDNGALEAVKEAEQRCFQVKCGHNTYTCILHVCTITDIYMYLYVTVQMQISWFSIFS